MQAAQPDGGLVDNRSLDMFRILNLTKYCYLFLTVIYLVLLNHLFFMTHNFLIFHELIVKLFFHELIIFYIVVFKN